MKLRGWLAVAGLVASAAYFVGRARAGVPTMTPLYYGGFLEDGNGPVTGSHAITIRLWDAVTAGNPLCAEGPVGVSTVSAGRFRVSLDDSCTAAVYANSDVFVEVKVDGTALPRSKAAAVPYALSAGAVPWSGVTGVDKTTPWPGTMAQQQTANGASYSIGPTKYCGTTSATTNGALAGGPVAAKQMCETACSSPTAHVCSEEERIRTVALGGAVPSAGWYAGNGGDCSGWTGLGDSHATIWQADGAVLAGGNCGVGAPPLPFHCCS
jgi:hypothetical protein